MYTDDIIKLVICFTVYYFIMFIQIFAGEKITLEIILKKYSPIGEMNTFAKQYAESLCQVSGHVALIADRDQFIAQVKTQQNALRSFLLALCGGNLADADDIAQESLVKAYLAIDRYTDSGKFKSWLFKIAHNTFLNHTAALKQYDSIEAAETVATQESADHNFAHQQLYLALSTLPPKERAAITLYYLSGYSIKEIAAITEVNADAVKKQLSRGRDRLKQLIKP